MSGKNKSYVPELTEKQQNPVFVYSENSQMTSLAAQFAIWDPKEEEAEI